MLVVKLEPVLRPVHQEPPCSQRPVMSSLPSPLKSPTRTSTQVTFGFQLAQKVVLKEVPVDMPVHQEPPSSHRAVMSMMRRPVLGLTAPLKSPTRTSTQVTFGFHCAQAVVLNDVPLEI